MNDIEKVRRYPNGGVSQAAHFEAARRLADEVERLQAEVARLHARLEDDHEFRLDEHGNVIRVDVEPGSLPDGIECRDATIRLQDENLDRLRALNKQLIAEVERLRSAMPTNSEVQTER